MKTHVTRPDGSHVVVSDDPSRAETMVFPADEHGGVTSFREIAVCRPADHAWMVARMLEVTS